MILIVNHNLVLLHKSCSYNGFFSLLLNDIGHGSGIYNSCKTREDEKERSKTKLNVSITGFFFNGIEYSVEDYVYISPTFITKDGLKKSKVPSITASWNIGLSAFVVCQLLEIIPEGSKMADLGSFNVKVRRFYRAEDVSAEKAYTSDIQELYYSQDTFDLPPKALEGKCEVRKKIDIPLRSEYPISDHISCELLYDSSNGSLKQLPANMKLKFSSIKDDTLLRKNKGKEAEISDVDSGIVKPNEVPKEMGLATLHIFAGCDGMCQGLKMAGMYYLLSRTTRYQELMNTSDALYSQTQNREEERRGTLMCVIDHQDEKTLTLLNRQSSTSKIQKRRLRPYENL